MKITKGIHYKGKGEHSVEQLESIVDSLEYRYNVLSRAYENAQVAKKSLIEENERLRSKLKEAISIIKNEPAFNNDDPVSQFCIYAEQALKGG